MRTGHALLVSSVFLLQLTGPGWSTASGAPVIDPEVRNAVGQGSARVLVELRVTSGTRPEGELPTPEAVAAQRRAIADARQSILSRLAGTHFSLARQYASVPLLALEIRADALAALETMGDVVARVRADTTAAPDRRSR